jgi:hypothetical protein
MFVWLIGHQPAVLLSQNKSATSNQPAVLFSQNKSAPATSQTNRLLVRGMTYLLSMHRVIAQFNRFLYIFNCCMLVAQLRLEIVLTYLSGRVVGCHL